jgi:alkylation response protein AidB-like acyl-CoA dehydrogenase
VELRFGEKEEQLRAEVRSFLREQLPPNAEENAGGMGARDDEAFEQAKLFNRALAERGWIAPAWPREYGGLGASIYEQMVFNEEFGYYGAPDTGTRGFGVGMIGPTLIVHGNEEQKREHLPRITSGEAIWCQGYSEPGAGSDLASLQTRAVRDGDRSGRAQAPRHQLLPARHQEHAGRDGAAADQHGQPPSLQRGVLRRRAHSAP